MPETNLDRKRSVGADEIRNNTRPWKPSLGIKCCGKRGLVRGLHFR